MISAAPACILFCGCSPRPTFIPILATSAFNTSATREASQLLLCYRLLRLPHLGPPPHRRRQQPARGSAASPRSSKQLLQHRPCLRLHTASSPPSPPPPHVLCLLGRQLARTRCLSPLLLSRSFHRLCRRCAGAARRPHCQQQLLQPSLHFLQHLQRRHAGIARKPTCLIRRRQPL